MRGKEALRSFLDQQIRMKNMMDYKEKELEEKMNQYQVQNEINKLTKNEFDKTNMRTIMNEDAKKTNNM